jgi:hypothetical protein
METVMSIPTDPAPIPARKWPLLDPKNDAVFKMMFASPRGRRPLIALLNAVLKPKSPICSVEVINPDIPKLLISDKGTILDIRAKLEDGTQIDVEMQMAPHLGLGKRALFYGARMYSQSIESGDYYHKLRPAIVLFFMAKDLFPTRPEGFMYVLACPSATLAQRFFANCKTSWLSTLSRSQRRSNNGAVV